MEENNLNGLMKTKISMDSFSQLANKTGGEIDLKINHNSSSNPFDKSEAKGDIQRYFSERYYNVNLRIKDISKRLEEKNGDIFRFLNDSIIDVSAVIAQYLYNGKLKMNLNDKKIYRVSKKNNLFVLVFEDENTKTIAEFDDYSILNLETKNDDETYKLIFYKRNFMDKLFNRNINAVKQYIKTDKNGNIIETAYFLKSQKTEKYIKFHLNKKEYEIIFDTSDWQMISDGNSNNANLIPLEYNGYDSLENLICRFAFQYSKPCKYLEYNSNTGRITKMFNIQGLSSLVSKYSFYNSLTGQVLAFGTL